MSLSSWDCLAFGPDGKPCDGVFESLVNKGDSLRIHKNWIYVESKDMWTPNRKFIKKTIAQIHEGSISIGPFDIVVKRCSQNGIFIYATEGSDTGVRYFAGVACDGYNEKDKWIGIKASTLREFWKWISVADGSSDAHVREHLEWLKSLKKENPEFEIKCTWKQARSDCRNPIFQEWVATCAANGELRFNQGNLYFARNAGVPLESSRVGKSKKPILEKLTK